MKINGLTKPKAVRTITLLLALVLTGYFGQFMNGQSAPGGQLDRLSYLPMIGGPGGGEFKGLCRSSEYLTGLELRVGDDVDAIRPLCASAANPTAKTTEWFGGPGGRPLQLRCPSRMPVVLAMDAAAEGAETVIINNIHLYCGLAEPHQILPANPSAVFDGPAAVPAKAQFPSVVGGSPIRYRDGNETCPAGQMATGIYGRSGVWLDALGLACGPMPPPSANSVKSIGRVNAGAPSSARGPNFSICDAAASARSRNSPAAPSLEAQCNASKVQQAAAEQRDLGPGPSGVPGSVCDAAQAALNRNAPEAADLVAKCRALGGGQGLQTPADQYALSGQMAVSADPLLSKLRDRQPEGLIRRGFDIGVAVTGSQTEWGPGKQKIMDSLQPAEQEGFKAAASFLLDRNRNAQLVAAGASIASSDSVVGQARNKLPDVRYWLGFDIASGLFGDPALGGAGHKSMGPGAEKIRNELSAVSQRGFNDSVQFHLSRTY